MAESFPNEWKTLWEKDKLLVTSNLSFSHSVFKRLALMLCKNQALFEKGLNDCQMTKLWKWKHLKTTNSLWWNFSLIGYCGEKEKMVVFSIFSFSHNVFKKFLFHGHENPELFGMGLMSLGNILFSTIIIQEKIIPFEPHWNCCLQILLTISHCLQYKLFENTVGKG